MRLREPVVILRFVWGYFINRKNRENINVIEKINKEINDSELSEDIKVAKSMVNLLQKYEKDRSDSKLSEDERKEAENNYKMWSENLKQLGGNDNA